MLFMKIFYLIEGTLITIFVFWKHYNMCFMNIKQQYFFMLMAFVRFLRIPTVCLLVLSAFDKCWFASCWRWLTRLRLKSGDMLKGCADGFFFLYEIMFLMRQVEWLF